MDPIVGRGRAYPNYVQIDVSKDTGYKIEGGFSVTPVFDAKFNDIVGIVVYKEKATGILSGGFTPVASILKVCKNHSINIDVLEVLYETRNLMIGVPSLPPNYLPRIENIEEIKKLLLADAVKYAVTSSAKQITALTGMGGMIRFVQSAIKLSYNVLLKDKTQLAGQILGRLICFSGNGIQSLLSQASGNRDGVRLLPITSSLKSAGGPLIRTLEGHDD